MAMTMKTNMMARNVAGRRHFRAAIATAPRLARSPLVVKAAKVSVGDLKKVGFAWIRSWGSQITSLTLRHRLAGLAPPNPHPDGHRG